MSPLRRLIVAGCWLAAATSYIAALLPQREAPHISHWDKLDHMVAFFTVSVLARLGYRRVSSGRLLLLISAFGGFIELSQAIPFIHRDAEWGDWIADTAATVIGLTVAWPVLAWWKRRNIE